MIFIFSCKITNFFYYEFKEKNIELTIFGERNDQDRMKRKDNYDI